MYIYFRCEVIYYCHRTYCGNRCKAKDTIRGWIESVEVFFTKKVPTLHKKALTLPLFKKPYDVTRKTAPLIYPATLIFISNTIRLVKNIIGELCINISGDIKTLRKYLDDYHIDLYIKKLVAKIEAASVERVKKLPLKEGAFLSITSLSFVFIYTSISAETYVTSPNVILQGRSASTYSTLKDVATGPYKEEPDIRELTGKIKGIGLPVKDKSIDFDKTSAIDLSGRNNAYGGPGVTFIPPDIYRGRSSKKELSITFDGGAGADEAKEILEALRQRNIKTTIFLTGGFIKDYPQLVRQMVKDGHEVGNHTMTHPHLTSFAKDLRHTTLPIVDKNFMDRELRGTARLFKMVTGEEMASLWRAPYGEVNEEIRQWAFEAGYIHVNWTRDYKRKETLDSLDWVDDEESRLYYSSEKIKKRILNFGRDGSGVGGGIVLMHLGTTRKSDKAVSMLGEIIDELEERGYRLVRVSELLKGDKDFYMSLKMLPKNKMLARLDDR